MSLSEMTNCFQILLSRRELSAQRVVVVGRGCGGLVVSVLAFYSDNMSYNPAVFSVCKMLIEKTKNKQKEAWVGPPFRKRVVVVVQ